jgi:hypothetical protein
VPFVTPEDEAEDFDDSFYTSALPPPYPGQGPIPGDPRPPDPGHFPPPPYPGQGPIPSDPRPSGLVTTTILLPLLIRVHLPHRVFPLVMSPLRTHLSRKT